MLGSFFRSPSQCLQVPRSTRSNENSGPARASPVVRQRRYRHRDHIPATVWISLQHQREYQDIPIGYAYKGQRLRWRQNRPHLAPALAMEPVAWCEQPHHKSTNLLRKYPFHRPDTSVVQSQALHVPHSTADLGNDDTLSDRVPDAPVPSAPAPDCEDPWRRGAEHGGHQCRLKRRHRTGRTANAKVGAPVDENDGSSVQTCSALAGRIKRCRAPGIPAMPGPPQKRSSQRRASRLNRNTCG